jgi:hypothetical protein
MRERKIIEESSDESFFLYVGTIGHMFVKINEFSF